jgi:peptidoglycan-N-acetylglucosamine deacetylase
MYFIKTPDFIKSLFPAFTWSVNTEKKTVYLTFDDGPVPQVTPWVLDQLKAFQAKATFFCVGENIDRFPDIFHRILEEGHQVGNHSYNHLAGWSTENVEYYKNIRKCAHRVQTDLFRPPYGKMKPRQAEFLSRHYKIVMWDILSGDFDEENSPEQCYKNVVNNVKNGSIVVFHDSLKAFPNLKTALPKILKQLQSEGYSFETIQAARETHAQRIISELAPTI